MKVRVFLLACLAALTLPALAEEPVVHQPVALVVFGEMDDALLQRAKSWAEENLAIPVPVLPAKPELALATFEEVRDQAKSLLEADRLGLVVLWKPSAPVEGHGQYFPEERIAVINLDAMLTPDTDAEVLGRRIERQVIRGICFAMGLEPNPNPQSAMFAYTTMEELDAIGRNLDPPWLIRLQEKAIASGIAVDAESPFNLVSPQ